MFGRFSESIGSNNGVKYFFFNSVCLNSLEFIDFVIFFILILFHSFLLDNNFVLEIILHMKVINRSTNKLG